MTWESDPLLMVFAYLSSHRIVPTIVFRAIYCDTVHFNTIHLTGLTVSIIQLFQWRGSYARSKKLSCRNIPTITLAAVVYLAPFARLGATVFVYIKSSLIVLTDSLSMIKPTIQNEAVKSCPIIATNTSKLPPSCNPAFSKILQKLF